MEGKIYEILEKLSLDMQDMKTEMQDMKTKINDIKATMATKDDLKELASKDDLELVDKQLHAEIQGVHDEVKDLRKDFNLVEITVAKNSYDLAKFKLVR